MHPSSTKLLVTTAPAAIIQFLGILTPDRIIAFAAIHVPSPIAIGASRWSLSFFFALSI